MQSVDHRSARVVGDDTDLQRLAARRQADKHRDRVVVSLEGLPVMSKGVEHVVVGDTVLAGAGLDVHSQSETTKRTTVNTC